tara:strand:+ start:87 stop:689 length:603 start_codon:yes stop_codon:yes gene_type:complete
MKNKTTTTRKTKSAAAADKATEALSSANITGTPDQMAQLLAKMTEMQATMDAQTQASEEAKLQIAQLKEEKQSIADAAIKARQGAVPDDLRENQLNAFLSIDSTKSMDKGKNVFSTRGQSRRHIRIVLETENGVVDRVLPVNMTLSSTKNGSVIVNAFVQTSDDYSNKTLVNTNSADPLGSFLQSDDGSQVTVPRDTNAI